jgi:hypothetical protein
LLNYDCGMPTPKPVVSITENAYESRLGNLFVGQTDFLTFNDTSCAWAGLVNPSPSCVDLYIDGFTISNFTDTPFVGQIWFNTDLPEHLRVAKEVSTQNLVYRPLPEPEVKLLYTSCLRGRPRNGINAFLRIVEPYSTLLVYQDGKQIIPPGGNYVIMLRSIEPCIRQLAKIVYSWWEA